MERHFEDGNPDVRVPLSCLHRWRQNQFLSRVSSRLGPYDTQRYTSGARQDARVACMTFCSIGSNLPATSETPPAWGLHLLTARIFWHGLPARARVRVTYCTPRGSAACLRMCLPGVCLCRWWSAGCGKLAGRPGDVTDGLRLPCFVGRSSLPSSALLHRMEGTISKVGACLHKRRAYTFSPPLLASSLDSAARGVGLSRKGSVLLTGKGPPSH